MPLRRYALFHFWMKQKQKMIAKLQKHTICFIFFHFLHFFHNIFFKKQRQKNKKNKKNHPE
jgi:hypothetical protein